MIIIWHDCKTDPPKKNGEYIVVYWFYKKELSWQIGYWNETITKFEVFDAEAHWGDRRFVPFEEMYGEPYKWAEVDLSGAE